MRFKHHSLRTETTYREWMKGYINPHAAPLGLGIGWWLGGL